VSEPIREELSIFFTYVAQGGDEGAEITVLLAHHYPRSVKAIHLNLLPWGSIPADQQTPEEKVWATTGDAYHGGRVRLPHGHFPALEQPDLFVKDLRESFRSAR
jgi:pimeloyl-ACP methyl ester carboxylesterase